jgi:hypothetical protein
MAGHFECLGQAHRNVSALWLHESEWQDGIGVGLDVDSRHRDKIMVARMSPCEE